MSSIAVIRVKVGAVQLLEPALLLNPNIRVWIPLAVVPNAVALKVLESSVGDTQH